MSDFFWRILLFLCRSILRLRYRVEVRGLKEIESLGEKGILFLPNHPSVIEPLFLYLHLWIPYRMRPLAVEYIYRTPLIKPLLRISRALAVPDFEIGVNQYKLHKGEKAMREIAEGLERGDNFLFYPGGKVKGGGKEVLGGASGAHELLAKAPSAKVVLIRTTGFWGSLFSRAGEEKTPRLPKAILRGCKAALKSGIFFLPRRKILIEIAPAPADFPRGASRLEFNRYLEKWYNQYPDASGKRAASEPLSLVSYSPWKEELLEVFQREEGVRKAKGPISDGTRDKVYGALRKILERPDLSLSPEMNLSLDLGMDSLNIAELIAFLARNFDVEEIQPSDLETVQTALEIAEGLSKKRDTQKKKEEGFAWPEEKERPPLYFPSGKTIPEVFLKSASRLGSFLAMGDDTAGALPYKRVKRAVLVLAAAFAEWPEQRIGVMLPASVGATIAILALQMAGKTPVMLNWTLGPRYLEEMVKIAEVKRVVSSWRFLDRLAYVEFGSLVEQFVLLEDVRAQLSLRQKLKGLFLSLLPPKAALKRSLPSSVTEESEAVVLFTSGTEAAPKGVPLSHKNILANQRDMIQCVGYILKGSDTFYGILPPFHSFGFSVASLVPVLVGVRIAFYPDPTNSFALAEGIDRWKVTLFCSAPSFLKGLFSAAKPEQLKTLRLFVSGAEKATEELYKRVEELSTGAKLIEGYGITECSPVLALNRPDTLAKGVGHFLPSVEGKTIHPETLIPLPDGQEGEICVRGPNVFRGYLGSSRDPFLEIEGKKWYRTGDLGKIEEGCLLLSGRLKRFVKLGGEMISLMAIEEALKQALLEQGKISPDVPVLAVIADERVPERPQLVLCAKIPLDLAEVQQILQKSGFSRLVKIHTLYPLEEIPLLGTGKTNFRKLQEDYYAHAPL